MRQASTKAYRASSIGDFFETISAYRYWFAILLLVNALDMASTALGLNLGLPEGNPVQASLLASHGEIAMFLSKLVLVAVMVLALHLLRSRFRRLWPFWLAMTVPTLLVVANNVVLIAQLLA